jgi:hypothetical protein
MADPNTPTRNQISRIAGNDPEMIKALERLFIVSGTITPLAIDQLTQLVVDNSFALGAADNKAEVAQTDATAAKRLADLLATAPIRDAHNSLTTDYIDLNINAPHVHQVGRFAWHDEEQTAEIGMEYGVVQQVGLEYYARVENATGVTIPDGTVVGFVGTGPGNVLSAAPYIADGSSPSLYVLGVMTHALPNSGQTGYCTVWGNVSGIDTTGTSLGETWSVGDILYASPSTAGAFTNIKPTAPNNVIPMAAVLFVDASDGEIFVRPTIEQQRYYAVLEKTTSQVPAAINTEYLLTFDAIQIGNGIAIGTPTSRMVVANSGLYQIEAKLQLTSGSSSAKNVWAWVKKNGTPIANSARIVTTDINGGYIAMSLTETISLVASDYIELAFAADNTNITVSSVAATGFAPAAPAVLLTITQVQQ